MSEIILHSKPSVKKIELGRKDGIDFRKEYYTLEYKYNDGGRKEAGYKGDAGDCVTRAISIVADLPYQKVYDDLTNLTRHIRLTSNKKWTYNASPKDDTARTGVKKDVCRKYLLDLGFKWTPTMFIGQGCKVHLRQGELPMGKLIVSVSRHLVAVINGVINDTYDCSRDATRCVYGYWQK